MQGYVADIEKLTEGNRDFRHVLFTGHHLQLVLMALKPGQSQGAETHATHDQFFRIEKGKGTVVIDGTRYKVKGGDCVIVPAGTDHDLTNTGDKPLRLYTLYAPPQHPDRLVQKGRPEAEPELPALDGFVSQ